MVILYTVYIVVMLYAVPYVPYIGLLKPKWYMTRLQNISVLKFIACFYSIQLPFVGRVPHYRGNVWVVGGFGSRGLIHHALVRSIA